MGGERERGQDVSITSSKIQAEWDRCHSLAMRFPISNLNSSQRATNFSSLLESIPRKNSGLQGPLFLRKMKLRGFKSLGKIKTRRRGRRIKEDLARRYLEPLRSFRAESVNSWVAFHYF